ncbi:MAG: AbrB/MazE/SpoVT family DNA-binding domain-containing protein [Schwartzia sp.]|nr:AbrB/MazE/SpoVT family DNA-binding domain-containing protein [Schwartzia sp. (in: firmicutes)]
MRVEVIRVSNNGQISIPTKIREKLSIANGDALAVYATDKVIVLKRVELPTAEEFSQWLGESQAWANEAGYAEADLGAVTKSVRRKKRQ